MFLWQWLFFKTSYICPLEPGLFLLMNVLQAHSSCYWCWGRSNKILSHYYCPVIVFTVWSQELNYTELKEFLNTLYQEGLSPASEHPKACAQFRCKSMGRREVLLFQVPHSGLHDPSPCAMPDRTLGKYSPVTIC